MSTVIYLHCDQCNADRRAENPPLGWMNLGIVGDYDDQHHFCSKVCLREWASTKELPSC